MTDRNLHFALLAGAGLLPKKRLAELVKANPPDLDGEDDHGDYVYNENLARALLAIKIPKPALAKVRKVDWIDEDIMFALWPQFDGESDEYAIEDLAGLAACPALEVCRLDNVKELEHVAVLGALVKLRELSLGYGCGVTSLATFGKLTELRELSVEGAIADVTPVAKLTELRLEGIRATDLAPLAKLPALQKLRLRWEHGAVGPARGEVQAFVDALSPTIAVDAAWPCGEVKPKRKKVAAARDPALEARLRADPEDDAAYLVYADWLQAKGDPAGQLIALDHQLAIKKSKTLAEERRALLVTHQKHLLGDYQPGDSAEWHLGFIREAHVSYHELAALLAAPAARFVSRLHVQVLDGKATLRTLARANPAPPLRVLHILEDIDPTDASAVWARYPQLREIALRGRIALGTIELPELRSARFRDCDDAAFAAIAKATWPALESLSLSRVYEVVDIATLVARRDLRALRRLELDTTDVDAIAGALATAPIVDKLDHLVIKSDAGLGEPGARAILAARARFARLTTFEVRVGKLAAADKAALATLVKRAKPARS